MNTSAFLQQHGWRQIGSQGSIKYWDHPEHQPDDRGAFCTIDAVNHQKKSEQYGCDCIKQEQGRLDAV